MKYLTFTFLILTIFSCNSKYDGYNEFDDMYNIFCGDFEKDIAYLTKKVHKQMDLIALDTIKSDNATEFHNLITEYNEYIAQVESKLMQATENPFFLNGSISELGTEYLTKNDFYREQLLLLIDAEYFKKKLKYKLRANSLQNRNGERINHIDYYFKGIRKSGTLAYLKNKRRNALEFEYEYLTNLRLGE